MAFVFLNALLWQQPAAGQTVRYVDNIGACDGLTPCSSTITDAINASAPSDSVEVFPGVYREAVVLSSKPNVVLRAHDEALTPVIAAPPGGPDAVAITTSPGAQVLNFLLEAPEAAGVALAGSPNAVIQGNLVTAFAGITLTAAVSCRANANTILGGGISLTGGNQCIVEANIVDGADIALGGESSGLKQAVLQHNLVRGGGILLSGAKLKGNTVASNFVSASTADGILLRVTNGGSGNLVQQNTSIDNAGCDIDDQSSGKIQNTWASNRFATKCGAATD